MKEEVSGEDKRTVHHLARWDRAGKRRAILVKSGNSLTLRIYVRENMQLSFQTERLLDLGSVADLQRVGHTLAFLLSEEKD
jgi:hypothetical protein